jgi:hypothetical protein
VDGFGGSDVLTTRISVLFIIVVVTISSLCVVVGPCGIIGGDLLGVDVLEEAAILHGVIGFGMKWLLIRVDFMIILTGTLASIVVATVAPPITVVSVVAIVVVPITTIAVVVLTTVIAVVVAAQWVFRA